DVVFGLRTLLRNPATSAIALFALALGIGANTAIFSVVNGVLLEPLPYGNPEKLVMVWEANPGRGFPRFSVSPPNFVDWRVQARSFDGLVATSSDDVNLTGREQPEALSMAQVSDGFFRVMGVPLALGRDFQPEEMKPGARRVTVLSHGLWQRRFGSDKAILDRPILLNGEPYTVVGVAAQGFEFPNERELWTPWTEEIDPAMRGAHYLRVIGRLKPGVSVEQAATEMTAIAARLEKQYPDSNTGWGALVISLRENVVQDIRPALLILLAAVSFVLLIACANVANLLLARVAAREREIAVRTALGAGRVRLVRQMLTESAVLFLGGGLLGLLIAFWGVKLLVAMDPGGLPRVQEIDVDGRVLLFTLGVSLVTGLLFGLIPAFHATSGGRLYDALKEGGRAMAGGGRGKVVRNALVLVEVAVALVLLVGAGLLIQSFSRLQSVDPGFQPDGVLTAGVGLPAFKYPDTPRQAAFYRQLVERLDAQPGVEAVGLISPLPLSGQRFVLTFAVEGRPAPAPNEEPNANIRTASPDYFKTVQIPLIKGRVFTDQDIETSLPVLLVNQTMAKQIWPGEDPLGKRITFDDATDPEAEWRTVVGVVGDVRHGTLNEDGGSEAYWPQFQAPFQSASIVVRAAGAGNPERLAGAVRQTVRALDPDLPVDEIRPFDEVVSEALSQSRFKTVLLGLFAAIALVLAAVGVYGVISYSVTQRTHEIGIRMALGAERTSVLRMVVRQGMVLVLTGVGVGVVLAWMASRYLETQVYGVSTSDPATFVAVPLVLAGVSLLANYLPARRATTVDPLEALRYE
ncbi:MAG TPA: ABC transporter permease, partial [Thermoanaerobaculia bacterium]|nr:ABC transporter permease [Thermoanaerobaculia bacterium]